MAYVPPSTAGVVAARAQAESTSPRQAGSMAAIR
jgi:hypothetical protein